MESSTPPFVSAPGSPILPVPATNPSAAGPSSTPLDSEMHEATLAAVDDILQTINEAPNSADELVTRGTLYEGLSRHQAKIMQAIPNLVTHAMETSFPAALHGAIASLSPAQAAAGLNYVAAVRGGPSVPQRSQPVGQGPLSDESGFRSKVDRCRRFK